MSPLKRHKQNLQFKKLESQAQINHILEEFRKGLQITLGEKLHAAYVYGAAAFPDTLPTGDIDFHVILNAPLSEAEKQALQALHTDLAERCPPLGGELDGYYLLLEDARQATPPRSQMWAGATDEAWALHREHLRAGRTIRLVGGDPRQIYLPANWAEIERALENEIRYVEEHLEQYPDYCILNLCRLLYSYQTREVVISKDQASRWALDALPEWSDLVELARKSYAKLASAQDRAGMLGEVRNFYEDVISIIEVLRG